MDNKQSTVNSSDDDDHNEEKSEITKFWCLFKDAA